METNRVAQRQCKGGGRNYRQTTTILGDFLCWEFGKKRKKTDLLIRQWGDLIKKRGSMAGNQAAESDQLLFARSLKEKCLWQRGETCAAKGKKCNYLGKRGMSYEL